jgi:hypothetical protein
METQQGMDTKAADQGESSLARDAWNIKPNHFPEQGSLGAKARFLLRYAVLAHSVDNAQPWSFKLKDDHIRMSAFRRPGSSLSVREMYFSLGCAVENLSVAARHFNLPHRVTYVPRGLAAFVNVDLDPDWTFRSGEFNGAFEQLTEDHISSTELDDRKLSYDHKERIRNVSCEDVVLLNLLEGAGGMGKILKFRAKIHDALNDQSRAEQTSSTDGDETGPEEPVEEQGFWQRILSFVRSLFFSSGEHEEEEEEQKNSNESSTSDTYEPPNPLPPAVVLSGWVDGPISWIKCGRVFQRVSLALGPDNVKVQPFHEVMRHSTARDEVKRMIDTPAETVPLFLFRVGYVSGEGEKSTRLPLDDVLVE